MFMISSKFRGSSVGGHVWGMLGACWGFRGPSGLGGGFVPVNTARSSKISERMQCSIVWLLCQFNASTPAGTCQSARSGRITEFMNLLFLFFCF